MVTLSEKLEAASYLLAAYPVRERSACRLLSIHRNTKRAYGEKNYKSEREQLVIELSLPEPHWGYRKVYDRLKLDGQHIGRGRYD